MFNWFAVAIVSQRWQIDGNNIWHGGPINRVNEQLTDDDLLSFVENQETALQDNSSCVGKLDAYLAGCNVNNNACSSGKKTLISFQNYQLHLKHHCIAATSASMERCFSTDGYIVNDQRSRLTDQTLEECWLLSATKTLWTSK